MMKTIIARVVSVCALMLLAFSSRAGAQVLYGAASGLTSSLYQIDPATGTGTVIGDIGVGVGAMAVHPLTGVIYAVSAPGFISPGVNQRQLLRINPATGAGTVIGPLALGNFGIADIAFRADGTLFGWSENSDDLITIDTNTGKGTIVANAAISTFGSGLAL